MLSINVQQNFKLSKKEKQLLPFKVCDIVIVIQAADLYNLGKYLITVSC